MAGTLTTPPQNARRSQAIAQPKTVKLAGKLFAKLSTFIELVGRFPRQIWVWMRTCCAAVLRQFRKVPRKLRMAATLAAVLLIGVGIFFWLTAASARLRIICQHTFRSAELSVWVDGNLVYKGTVNGIGKKRFGVFNPKNGQPTLSKTVAVRPGKHDVQVRLNSPAENYDQTKTQSVSFSDNKENSLTVNGGRRGLSILAQGGFIPPPETPATPYQKYAGPILFSILGSGFSATISFLVQEFLRSQKARLANPILPRK